MVCLYPILGALLLLPRLVTASCECGYQTNTGDTWQYSIVTDFSATDTTTFASSADWTIVSSVHENATANPYTLAYLTDNVVVQGAALELTCSAYDPSSDKTIYGGEITTQRDDIRYGSFRSHHRVRGGSGAVAALFFYANDTQEIDIEHVTDDAVSYVHFTNQPDDTITTYMPNKVQRTSYASYRFDWRPSQASFYVDDVLSGTFTGDVPAVNGTIQLNSWANGGSFTGAAVPTSDSVMSVQWIKLYFNTSDTSAATAWASACETAAVAACLVDADEITLNTTATSTASRAASFASPSRHSAGGSWWFHWSAVSAVVACMHLVFSE